jgi:8-oxo-dGTP diphosphatase
MKPRLFVAAKAFITHRGKVLVVRESSKYDDAANVAKYDVPGGRIEPGQRFDESLLREIKEETGLDVRIGKPFFVNEWRPVVRGEQWQIVGTFFECEASSDNVVLGTDHDDFKWIDPSEYKQYNLIENLYPAFEAYLKEKMVA